MVVYGIQGEDPSLVEPRQLALSIPGLMIQITIEQFTSFVENRYNTYPL
jgi:hypothetical protein